MKTPVALGGYHCRIPSRASADTYVPSETAPREPTSWASQCQAGSEAELPSGTWGEYSLYPLFAHLPAFAQGGS